MTQNLREQIERRLAWDDIYSRQEASDIGLNPTTKRGFVRGAEWQHAQSTEGLAELIAGMAEGLESANKTLRYVQEEYAHGHGVKLIYETVSTDECALARLQDWLKQKDVK